MVNGLIDYEFQDNCVDYLFDKTTSADSKKIITPKIFLNDYNDNPKIFLSDFQKK